MRGQGVELLQAGPDHDLEVVAGQRLPVQRPDELLDLLEVVGHRDQDTYRNHPKSSRFRAPSVSSARRGGFKGVVPLCSILLEHVNSIATPGVGRFGSRGRWVPWSR